MTDRESFEKRLDALDPILLVALMQGAGPETLRRHLDAMSEMELERQKMALRERKTNLAIRVARNAVALGLVATAMPFSPWILTSAAIPAAVYVWWRR
ncbi:MAG: hypothetical protein JJE35_09915 [Thermoleophilia bacterium]|nr:hypothetical protein [Thermoleophilia bacterium]